MSDNLHNLHNLRQQQRRRVDLRLRRLSGRPALLAALLLVTSPCTPASRAAGVEGPPCEHNLVPLREYIDQRFTDFARTQDERQRTITVQFDELAKALTVALSALGLRLENMNEFRAQLTAQAALLVTRDLFDARFKEWDIKLGLLESRSREAVNRDLLDALFKESDAKRSLLIDQLNRLEKAQSGMVAYMMGYAAGAAAVGGLMVVGAQILLRNK